MPHHQLVFQAMKVFLPIATLIGAGLCLATLLGFGGQLWWTLDLFSHFRVQYGAGLWLLAVICGMGRKWKSTGVFLLFALWNSAIVWPWLSMDHALPKLDGAPVRIMLINVNTHGGDPELVLKELERWNPAVLVLEEISEQWLHDLDSGLTTFPHTLVRPRSDNFGIGIFSKLPLRDGDSRSLSNAEVPTLFAVADWKDYAFQIIATHPVPPMGAEYAANRNQQLHQLGKSLNPNLPNLVVGDLNATPWNRYFQQLLQDSGLIDSSMHRGLQTTWPTSAWFLRIPLDHVLHTPDIRVVNRWVGEDVGSDHLPVVVDFDLPQSSPALKDSQ
jgi:endonuclease/exonuclease/phosphatase (EEP) superfamily protein YafD